MESGQEDGIHRRGRQYHEYFLLAKEGQDLGPPFSLRFRFQTRILNTLELLQTTGTES